MRADANGEKCTHGLRKYYFGVEVTANKYCAQGKKILFSLPIFRHQALRNY
jgi:hypothetical protein